MGERMRSINKKQRRTEEERAQVDNKRNWKAAIDIQDSPKDDTLGRCLQNSESNKANQDRRQDIEKNCTFDPGNWRLGTIRHGTRPCDGKS